MSASHLTETQLVTGRLCTIAYWLLREFHKQIVTP
jgi:hypothetical protein